MSKQNVRLQISDDAIAKRAYELWQQRGCPEGDGGADWENAKAQLMAEAKLPPFRKPLRRLIAQLRRRAAL